MVKCEIDENLQNDKLKNYTYQYLIHYNYCKTNSFFGFSLTSTHLNHPKKTMFKINNLYNIQTWNMKH